MLVMAVQINNFHHSGDFAVDLMLVSSVRSCLYVSLDVGHGGANKQLSSFRRFRVPFLIPTHHCTRSADLAASHTLRGVAARGKVRHAGIEPASRR
jgi:hypothetical protein